MRYENGVLPVPGEPPVVFAPGRTHDHARCSARSPRSSRMMPLRLTRCSMACCCEGMFAVPRAKRTATAIVLYRVVSPMASTAQNAPTAIAIPNVIPIIALAPLMRTRSGWASIRR